MITYKKITYKNKNELTDELIEKIYNIDTLTNNQERLNNYAEELRNEVSFGKIIYLINNNEKVLGTAMCAPIKSRLILNFIFVDPTILKQGIGTKLLFHVVADIRVNTNYKNIYLSPLAGTREILNKLDGTRKMKTNKAREYKTTKFKYSVDRYNLVPYRINIERYQKPKSLTKKISASVFRYVSKLKHKIKRI